MSFRYLLALLVCCTLTARAQYTLETVPDPKQAGGGYVSNPDAILSAESVATINRQLIALEEQTTVQVAVVALNSIGDEDIFTFAQGLFTRWGIGNREKDNGLLILLVEDSHTIRFHTGYGLEGALPDVICKRIQRDAMVPEFKNGDYNAGILVGLDAVEKVLTDPAYAEEMKADTQDSDTYDDAGPSDHVGNATFLGTIIFFAIFIYPILMITFAVKLSMKTFADSQPPKSTPYPEMRLKKRTWATLFLFAPALILAGIGLSGTPNPMLYALLLIYVYFLSTLFYRLYRVSKVISRLLVEKNYQGIVTFLSETQYYWLFMAFIFPAPFVLYFVYHLRRKRIYRNHPRTCEECNGKMKKLNEQDDDAYLSQSQRIEEQIRSIDYDVWLCESCHATAMWHYPGRSSRYSVCDACKATTMYLASDHTITPATYSSTGRGVKTYECKHCLHEKKKPYTISKLQHSSSGSSSSSGGSSSSSSSSWGGGSSGGGGASSSW